MKQLLALIGLVAISAPAQLITIGPSTGTTAAGDAAASSVKTFGGSGTNVIIDCRNQQNVAVQVEFACLGAGTDVVQFHFVPKVDVGSTNIASGDILSYHLTCAATGTTTKKYGTNFVVKGYPYLMLDYVSNSVAQVMTNITFKYFVKRNAP